MLPPAPPARLPAMNDALCFFVTVSEWQLEEYSLEAGQSRCRFNGSRPFIEAWIGLGALAQSLCEGAELGRIYNDNGQSRRRETRRKHRLEATAGFDGDRHDQADVPFALPQIQCAHFDQ
jgi:hypothetical protein